MDAKEFRFNVCKICFHEMNTRRFLAYADMNTAQASARDDVQLPEALRLRASHHGGGPCVLAKF